MKYLEMLRRARKQHRELNLCPDPNIDLITGVFESVVAQERDDDVLLRFDPAGVLLRDVYGIERPFQLEACQDRRDIIPDNLKASPNISIKKPKFHGTALICARTNESGIPELLLYINQMGFNPEVWRSCGTKQLLRETNIHITGRGVTKESAADDARRNNITRAEELIALGIALISDADQPLQVAQSKPVLFDRNIYPNGRTIR